MSILFNRLRWGPTIFISEIIPNYYSFIAKNRQKDIEIVQKTIKLNKTHKVHAPKFQGVFFLGVLKRRRQCITHAPCWKTPKQTKVYSTFRNIRKYTKHE